MARLTRYQVLGWKESRQSRSSESCCILWYRSFWRRCLPIDSPHQASSNYVRGYVGCFSVCRQEPMAHWWNFAIRLQHEPRVRFYLEESVSYQMLTYTYSGPAAHGDYVFGWKGNSLQLAMDNSCNLNVACPKAGLTVQSSDKYSACTIPQRATETVDGCKLNTCISIFRCSVLTCYC